MRQAARIIRAGGLIAYPTEGVYGLGCRPDLVAPVARLLEVKGRPAAAGLILIAASPAQLAGWIAPTAAELRRLREPRAAPVTWVVTAGPLAPGWITGGRPTIAVRITRHPAAMALCQAAGMPLVSTSANRRGRPPARSALAVRRWFGRDIDLVVGGPTGGAPGPSEIRDAASGAVLRRG
jgi:L-threonylcarbamoyladenylate synthase